MADDDVPIIPLSVQRGDDFDQLIGFFVRTTNAAVPLTQLAAVRFTVREVWALSEQNNDDAVFAASWTPVSSDQLSAYDASSLKLEVPHADTQAWQLDEYFYDVKIDTIEGKRITTQKGPLRMSPDVGRSA